MITPEATSPPAAAAPPAIPLAGILTAISDLTRWRILDELLKGEPLPSGEMARRFGVPANNISKHCAVLTKAGLIQCRYGKVYRIPPSASSPASARWTSARSSSGSTGSTRDKRASPVVLSGHGRAQTRRGAMRMSRIDLTGVFLTPPSPAR